MIGMPLSPIDFKIIAIRPGSECSKDYTKILTSGEIYYFYEGYNITESKISCKKRPMDSLFNFGNDHPKVNVSAIVGKNGTGKSTIIELLFMAINNITSHFFYHHVRSVIPKLKPIEGLEVDLFIQRDDKIYLFSLNGLKDQIVQYSRVENTSDFLVDQMDDNIIHLSEFFYSIAVNYSHYSLNSNQFGSWIQKLFHKNDGYQTPLVINPMRTAGNIDINEENHLVMARLLTNLLAPVKNTKEHWKITENQSAKSLTIKLNVEKVKVIYYEQIQEKGPNQYKPVTFSNDYFKVVSRSLMKIVYEEFGQAHPKTDKYLKKYLEKYILKKLVKIARTYPEYRRYFSDLNELRITTKGAAKMTLFVKGDVLKGGLETGFRNLDTNFRSYLKKLKNDGSHITFKLKQAVNFLHYNPLCDETKFGAVNYRETITLSLSILSSHLLDLQGINGESVINLLPPSLFQLDLLLETKKGQRVSHFSSLSSGEKQLIHTANSVYYHLINLDSIFNKRHGRLKAKYNCVAIVLEEIELYFHPETQRKYVKHILDGLNRLSLQNVSGINICFVTHSPYILSDIPSSNIMFLDINPINGLAMPQEVKMNTFGRNINDLLSNGFFMAEGLIGEYAQLQIQNVIDSLVKDENPKLSKRQILDTINIIGEPYLQEKLRQMYYDKYPADFKSEEARLKKIRELEAEISRLKKPKS